jgi:hypothetical protein
MNISNISSNNLFLGSYNSNSLRKIQINTSINKENIDISLKELKKLKQLKESKEVKAINNGKHLAREYLDSTCNSNINKKLQESLEHKLSQLNEMKSMIENKHKKNYVVDIPIKNTKINTSFKNIAKTKHKKETLLNEDDQVNLKNINNKIAETNSELEGIRILGKELSKQCQMVDDRISTFRKMYSNDIFKMAKKEIVLKQIYETHNNPLIKELKSNFDEIIELETQLKDK